MKSFEEQVEEVKHLFQSIPISIAIEGGTRFLVLPQFIHDPVSESSLDALFACDPHLGYSTRLWVERSIKTSEQRNWNNVDCVILGRRWSAFSFKVDSGSLSEMLLAHMRGFK